MSTLSRRKVLKNITALAASSAVPFSLHAAKSKPAQHIALYVDSSEHMRHQPSSEIVNRSQKDLVLNASQPISYKTDKGHYTSIYLNTPNEFYTLKPGERLPVYAKAVMTSSPQTLISNKILSDKAIAVV